MKAEAIICEAVLQGKSDKEIFQQLRASHANIKAARSLEACRDKVARCRVELQCGHYFFSPEVGLLDLREKKNQGHPRYLKDNLHVAADDPQPLRRPPADTQHETAPVVPPPKPDGPPPSATDRMPRWGKTAIFLGLNVGIQLPPILYLYARTHGEALREYVNCTLLVGFAFCMLVATISDLITDRCRVGGGYWGILIGLAALSLLILGFVIELEFVKKERPDAALLVLSIGMALALSVVGASVKIVIWGEHDGGGGRG
jgi:hypothetical protein